MSINLKMQSKLMLLFKFVTYRNVTEKEQSDLTADELQKYITPRKINVNITAQTKKDN